MNILEIARDYGALVNITLAVSMLAVAFRLFGRWEAAASKEYEANLAKQNAELEAAKSKLAILESQFQAEVSVKDERILLYQEQIGILKASNQLRNDPLSGQYRPDPRSGAEHYKKIFQPNERAEFYNLVAPYYDSRNRGIYGQSYQFIYDACCEHFSDLDRIDICDLGGGTGFLLTYFSGNHVCWLNIDFADKALAVYENNFSSYRLKAHRKADLALGAYLAPNERFDIVVVSFLLSSINGTLDWAYIRSALKPGGLVVVADNHFSYVEKNKWYGFDEIEGNVAIEPRPIHGEQVISALSDAGFVHKKTKHVLFPDGRIYAQVLVFSTN